jgi:hypothetical protein
LDYFKCGWIRLRRRLLVASLEQTQTKPAETAAFPEHDQRASRETWKTSPTCAGGQQFGKAECSGGLLDLIASAVFSIPPYENNASAVVAVAI